MAILSWNKFDDIKDTIASGVLPTSSAISLIVWYLKLIVVDNLIISFFGIAELVATSCVYTISQICLRIDDDETIYELTNEDLKLNDNLLVTPKGAISNKIKFDTQAAATDLESLRNIKLISASGGPYMPPNRYLLLSPKTQNQTKRYRG